MRVWFNQTDDDWVLDSGCGFGLTSDKSNFIEKRVDKSYTFTFGQGSKLHNTYVGSIKLYFYGVTGIEPFYFNNIALVPNATSNIISENQL
jgi:hypothetical protein